jgi:FtsP/CotA-like multicopper oxidase with cupredoxin domain
MVSNRSKLTRRGLLGAAAGAGALAVAAGTSRGISHGDSRSGPDPAAGPHAHGPLHAGTRGHVDHDANGFSPDDVLTTFDEGTSTRLPGGRLLRTWEIVATAKEIQVAPGVAFVAWAYNERVPGPTFRAREGDRLRIRFVNKTDHPHTMHFHGIHPSAMDGIPGTGPGGLVEPNGEFTYEFDALPFGLHLYHCHSFPLASHIHKGLYGAFVIDPKEPRADARELVMVQNGFDTNFDGANEVYAVNTVAFHFMHHPIRVRRDELVRIYLVNVLEFDPINSFHLHANFFDYYPTGTSLTPAEFTDTISQVQGQRGILEVRFPYAGQFMFHAHKSEFAELGWVGLFDVT